jgi:hypothetical protein
MGNVFAFQHSESCSHANAIVGAKSCAVSLQPVAIVQEFDGIGVEIMNRALVFLADHVEVALQ